MRKWLGEAVASIVRGLTMSMGERSLGVSDPTHELREVQEPQRQQDEWDRVFHHDDVTPAEIEALQSDDPERVKAVQHALAERQALMMDTFGDPEKVRELFRQTYFEQTGDDPNLVPTPMNEKPGWEDDDMPETFFTRDPDTGKLIEERFDDYREWRD